MWVLFFVGVVYGEPPYTIKHEFPHKTQCVETAQKLSSDIHKNGYSSSRVISSFCTFDYNYNR